MCRLFHKWDKWSAPKQVKWVTYHRDRFWGELSNPIEYLRTKQFRFCFRCKKYEERFLDEY